VACAYVMYTASECGCRMQLILLACFLSHVLDHPCLHPPQHLTLFVCILELALSITADSAVVHECVVWLLFDVQCDMVFLFVCVLAWPWFTDLKVTGPFGRGIAGHRKGPCRRKMYLMYAVTLIGGHGNMS